MRVEGKYQVCQVRGRCVTMGDIAKRTAAGRRGKGTRTWVNETPVALFPSRRVAPLVITNRDHACGRRSLVSVPSTLALAQKNLKLDD